MQYRRLGRSGLKLSALSFGSWVTFGSALGDAEARECLALAYDRGVNFFDSAEVYLGGEAERMLGRAIKALGWPRDAFCVSSKVLYGTGDNHDPAKAARPTQQGLSRKHIVEALADGVIPTKYKELMAIAVALTAQCLYCLEVHRNATEAAGASREELAEASFVAAALRAGAAFTHASHLIGG